MPGPVVIDATIGGLASNSYSTLAEADTYHATVLGGEAWTDFDRDIKHRALVSATRLLDQNVRWIGYRARSDQALAWPRSAAIDSDGVWISFALIPKAVKDATAQLARQLIDDATAGNTGEDDTAGIKRFKAGPIDIEFKDDATSPPPLPDAVYRMIQHLAARKTGGGIRQVAVVRT